MAKCGVCNLQSTIKYTAFGNNFAYSVEELFIFDPTPREDLAKGLYKLEKLVDRQAPSCFINVELSSENFNFTMC